VASCSHVYGAALFSQRIHRRFVVPKEPANTLGAYFEVMLHVSGTDFIWSEDGVDAQPPRERPRVVQDLSLATKSGENKLILGL